jgi:uncharacterized membrane protein YgcG
VNCFLSCLRVRQPSLERTQSSFGLAGVVALVVSGAVASNGCLVVSLQPAYDDESVLFDEALLGHWENAEDGERAIAELNGKEVNGRELKVNEAKPQESRGGGGRGGFGGGGGRGGDRGRGGYDGGGGGGGYGGNRW